MTGAKPREVPFGPLTAREVGLVEGDELPFTHTVGRSLSPLVVSFPHVGLEWPRSSGHAPPVNLARNADYEVDAIYPALEDMAATCVRGRFSRLVIDLNRADDDVSASLVPDHPEPRPREAPGGGVRKLSIENRGVLWSHAVGRIPILRSLPYADFTRRIEKFHRPYYRALEILLQERAEHFGFAVLLDAHSMPSAVQQDLVLGTLDGGSCGPRIAELAVQALSAPRSRLGTKLRFSRDAPYKGGEIVRRFGRPNLGWHALQLEVNRALYMDEYRLQLVPRPSESGGSAMKRGNPRARTAELYRRVEALVRALSQSAGGDARSPTGDK